MHKIKLTIEYDGTNYVGWQLQPNGISVQQVMEAALAGITGEPVRLHSSGRTDAGVHAKGMVACFSTLKMLPFTAYIDGMNSVLPPDIAVRHAEEVSIEFNPRHHAKGKHYRYSILTSNRRSPLLRLYSWHLRESLDLDSMIEGAVFFVGEHDFAAFRTSGCVARTTVRRIDSVTVSASGDMVHIDVIGSGFLRNMVRIMAGTLVEVGRRRMQPEDVGKCLVDTSRPSGPTAPPHGLSLIEVFY